MRNLPKIVVHVLHLTLVLGLMSCAGTKISKEPLKYPADISDPYLILTQVIDGQGLGSAHGFKRALALVFGESQQSGLNQPTDMAVDGQDRLLITDSEGGVIVMFEKRNDVWEFLGKKHIDQIEYPVAIAANRSELFISDLNTAKVYVLNNDFKIVRVLEHEGMKRPGDLAYDEASHRLFVADPPAGRVWVFDASGAFVAELGAASGRGSLHGPIAVSLDPDNGDVYVLDALDRKVVHYSADFAYRSGFGQYDQVPGSFAFPKGIAMSQDKILFIVDAAFGNIQMFDPSGALLFFLGEMGTERGQFLMPRNIYMDADQSVYVADPYNNRVQIFQYFPQP